MKISLKFIILTFLVGIGIITFYQCETNSNTEAGSAPILPPESSMVADFSAFAEAPVSNYLLDTISFTNYAAAFWTVAFWNTILTVHLAVPVIAFREAFRHEPTYNDKGKYWQWEYTVKHPEYNLISKQYDTVFYTAQLQGKLISDSVDWKMYLSKSGGFTNFLWYQGRSALRANGGWWIVYEHPITPQTFLSINWHRDNDTIGWIKYTNIRPNSSKGYLEYGTQVPDENGMNAYYNVMDTVNNKTIQIKVDLITHKGRIKKLNQNYWSCWDESHYDVDCD